MVKELMTLYSRLNWNEEHKENKLQTKLDEMYINKAKGTYKKNSLLNIKTPRLLKIKIDYADLVHEKCNDIFEAILCKYCIGRTRSTLSSRL